MDDILNVYKIIIRKNERDYFFFFRPKIQASLIGFARILPKNSATNLEPYTYFKAQIMRIKICCHHSLYFGTVHTLLIFSQKNIVSISFKNILNIPIFLITITYRKCESSDL